MRRHPKAEDHKKTNTEFVDLAEEWEQQVTARRKRRNAAWRVWLSKPKNRERRNAYYAKPEVRERKKATNKVWYECPRNKKRRRAQIETWCERNPERYLASCKARKQRRRCRLKEVGGSFTASEWLALKKEYQFRCLCCGKRKKLTPDHVVPISTGGSNSIENLQPLCGPCNSKKGTKTTDFRPAWDSLLLFLTPSEIARIAWQFYQDRGF